MSGFMFLHRSGQGVNRHTAVIAALFVAANATAVLANPLDWFRGGGTGNNSKSKKISEARVVLSQKNPDTSIFGTSAATGDLTGQTLDPMSFARAHWSHAKNQFEKVAKAIIQKGNNRDHADLIQKIFIIDTQVFKEAIKNSAQAINELSQVNESMRQQLADLSRIITAPGQETLESLEKAVAAIAASNQRQTLVVKKYLVGSEKIVAISNKSYETLELIPSLAVTGTDMTIASSKQLMKISQSNAEAFKGLMLNVQASYEQVQTGLETITRTVKETLRFSDHFAIKQFPLINLPAPSREKVYVQLNSLNNSLKNVGNTLSIGDSQVRNTAQQFTHLISALSAKVAEALKFAGEAESPDKALAQISNYAQNQVAGLFQRVKEDVRQMRSEMVAVTKNGGARIAPGINIESRQDFAARRTKEVSQEKLPLFLLGGKGSQPKAPAAAPTGDGFKPLLTASAKPAAKKEIRRVLYSEQPVSADADILGAELELIREELGDNFFFAETADSGMNLAKNQDSFDDDEIEEDENAGYPASDDDEMQISYENLNSPSQPEVELLKFDMSENLSDNSDLIPMMRMDEDSLSFEE